MILKIRHKGLKKFYNDGLVHGLNSNWVSSLEVILTVLDVAHGPEDINLPGLRLHSLKGNYKGFWAFIKDFGL